MNVVIVTGASAEEIAALVFAVQERQKSNPERKTQENDWRESMIRQYERYLSELKSGELAKYKEMPKSERESLVRQYERRLAKLKAGASPGNIAV